MLSDAEFESKKRELLASHPSAKQESDRNRGQH